MTTDQLLSDVQIDARAKGQSLTGRALERALDRVIRTLTTEMEPWRRHEILVPTVGTAEYALGSGARRILAAWYDGAPLDPTTEEEASARADDWRTYSDTPSRYVPCRDRIRLVPVPTASGTALTWSGAAPITAAVGYTIAGHGYWLGDNAGARFFRPHDGTCTNPDAADNLLVRYTYAPTACDFDSTIPVEFEQALEALLFAAVVPGDPILQRNAEIAKNAIRPDVAPKRRSLRGEAYW